jgi:hypothetical protein
MQLSVGQGADAWRRSGPARSFASAWARPEHAPQCFLLPEHGAHPRHRLDHGHLRRMADPFGPCRFDGGHLHRPDHRRHRQAYPDMVLDGDVALPGLVLGAGDHDHPEQSSTLADTAGGDDQGRPVLPAVAVQVGEGDADDVTLLKTRHRPFGPSRCPIR